jgi:MshEN domain
MEPEVEEITEVDADDSGAVSGGGSLRPPLGQMFIDSGLATQAQIDSALLEGSQTGERLGETLVRHGIVSEEDVAKTLALQWELGFVDRASISFDPSALQLISREEAQRLEAIPTRVQDGRIVVAVAEPTEHRLAALQSTIGDDAVFVVVPRSALEAALSSELLASRPVPDSDLDDSRLSPVLDLTYGLETPTDDRDDGSRFRPTLAPPPPAESRSAAQHAVLVARLERLEAELALRRAASIEAQIHLEAAIRALRSES